MMEECRKSTEVLLPVLQRLAMSGHPITVEREHGGCSVMCGQEQLAYCGTRIEYALAIGALVLDAVDVYVKTSNIPVNKPRVSPQMELKLVQGGAS